MRAQRLEDAPSFVEVACRRRQPAHAELRECVRRFELEGFVVTSCGLIGPALLFGLLTLEDQEVGLRGDHGTEELSDRLFGDRAHELVRQAAVPERLHRGDALDGEGLGDLRVGVDVDLRQEELPVVFARQPLQDRADQTAGLAPSRPEVDHHRPALRLGQDELTEGLIGDLHDVALSGDGGHV